MSDDELFTRLWYFGMAHLGMSEEEIELTNFGFMLDLFECYVQEMGMAKPRERLTTVDKIFK